MVQTAHRIDRVEEYYFSRKLGEVKRLNAINLGIGSPDMAPSGNTILALQQTAAQDTSHGYQAYKGTPALRLAIAGFYQRIYNVNLDPEKNILPLMGSKEGIMHITLTFLNEGEEVLIPDPGYPTYASVSQLMGAKVTTYPLVDNENWRIDFEALEQRDLSGVKIMWINSPHMPTGSVLDKADMERLVILARKNNFLLVNDNPYSLILNDYPQSILSCDGAEEVALELNSLSKSHNMAGWRVGWLAGNPRYVEAVLRVKSNMDSGMFLGIQQAATVALQQGTEWFRELNAVYKKRRQEAYKILDILGCKYSTTQAGLFVWAQAPGQVADVEKWIDEILYQAGVFITPGFIFGQAGVRYIRLSLCATEIQLAEARNRIVRWIEGSDKKESSHLKAHL